MLPMKPASLTKSKITFNFLIDATDCLHFSVLIN